VTVDDLQHLYLVHTQLHLCGCGDPDEAWETVRLILNLCPLGEGGWRDVEDRLTPGGAHIVLSCLTHAGLIEHGSSIRGSWITGKGRWVLARLAQLDSGVADATDSVGVPHDGGPCPPGCPVDAERAS